MTRPLSAAEEVAGCVAAVDQLWAAMRDVVFDVGKAEVDAMSAALGSDGAPAWIRAQPDDRLRVVGYLAGLTLDRMSLEVLEGFLDDLPREGGTT